MYHAKRANYDAGNIEGPCPFCETWQTLVVSVFIVRRCTNPDCQAFLTATANVVAICQVLSNEEGNC